MKTHDSQKDPLKRVLTHYGTTSSSEQFSARLKHMVVTRYKISYSRRYRKEERLGKWIISVLILSCVLILLEMNLSLMAIQLVIPVLSLGIGLLLVILMIRKASSRHV
ncbi:MAG: hypothetical protein H7Z72_12840 [Bacteroidetes bacterium]|nr:hypothetical protein [Fibrella sp.]